MKIGWQTLHVSLFIWREVMFHLSRVHVNKLLSIFLFIRFKAFDPSRRIGVLQNRNELAPTSDLCLLSKCERESCQCLVKAFSSTGFEPPAYAPLQFILDSRVLFQKIYYQSNSRMLNRMQQLYLRFNLQGRSFAGELSSWFSNAR